MNQQSTSFKADDDDGYCSRSSLDSPIQISKLDPSLQTSPTKPSSLDDSDCNINCQDTNEETSSSLLVVPSTSSGPSSFLEVMLTRNDWNQSTTFHDARLESSSVFSVGLTSSEILTAGANAANVNINSDNLYDDQKTLCEVSSDVGSARVHLNLQADRKIFLKSECIKDSFDIEPRKMIKLMPSSSSQNLLFYTRKSALGGLVVSSKPLNSNPPKIVKNNTNYNSSILIKNNNPQLITSSSNAPKLHSFAASELLKTRISLLPNETQCLINNGVIKTNNNHFGVNNLNKGSLLVNTHNTCTSARTSQPYNKVLKGGSSNSSISNTSTAINQSRSCWYVGRHELHPVIDHDYCEFSTFNAEIQSGIILMSSETLARTDRLNLRRNKTISVLNSSPPSNANEVNSDQGKILSNKSASQFSNTNIKSNYSYNNIDVTSNRNINKTNSIGRKLHSSSSSSSLISKNSVGRPKSLNQKFDKQMKQVTKTSLGGYDSSEDVHSPPLSDDKNYVKIPGSFQNDFVYFATTRGRSSRKRLADRKLVNSTNDGSLTNYNRVNNISNVSLDANNNNLCNSSLNNINNTNLHLTKNISYSTTMTTTASALNTFAWYKEMAKTDKSSRFGTTTVDSTSLHITSQQPQQPPPQITTPDESFNIDDMTDYLCLASEDYNNNNCNNKMLTSESDVVDLVMQMLPTSDLMLPQQNFSDQHLFFNSSLGNNNADSMQSQQNLFFDSPTMSSCFGNFNNSVATNSSNENCLVTNNIDNDDAVDNNSNNNINDNNDSSEIKNINLNESRPSNVSADDGLGDDDVDEDDEMKSNELPIKCHQTTKGLDFSIVTTSSELLDEINDNDLLITNDMPPCINVFFQDLPNDNSSHTSNDDNNVINNNGHINDDISINEGHDNYNNVVEGCDNNDHNNNSEDSVHIQTADVRVNDDNEAVISIMDSTIDHNNNSDDSDNNNNSNKENEDSNYDKVDVDSSDKIFNQHELVLTDPTYSPMTPSAKSFNIDNVENIVQQHFYIQQEKNHHYSQQQLEWPKNLSPCQLSPPLSSPSLSLLSPSSSSLTPPELTSVNMYWNDLPGLLINGQEFVRLVDIHKQIMPAKDTGILKKRCTMLNLKFMSCSELQRDFLIRYMNAAKSKSKIIVSKDTALKLISFYVNPKMKCNGQKTLGSENGRVLVFSAGKNRNCLSDEGQDSSQETTRSVLRPSLNRYNNNHIKNHYHNNNILSQTAVNTRNNNNGNMIGITADENSNSGTDSIKRSARLQNKRFSYLDMVNNCLPGSKPSSASSPLNDQQNSSSLNATKHNSNKILFSNVSSRFNNKSRHSQLSGFNKQSLASNRNNVNVCQSSIFLNSSSINRMKMSRNRQRVLIKSAASFRPKVYTTSRGTKHTRRWSHDDDMGDDDNDTNKCNNGSSYNKYNINDCKLIKTSFPNSLRANSSSTISIPIATLTNNNVISTNASDMKRITRSSIHSVEHCYAAHPISFYTNMDNNVVDTVDVIDDGYCHENSDVKGIIHQIDEVAECLEVSNDDGANDVYDVADDDDDNTIPDNDNDYSHNNDNEDESSENIIMNSTIESGSVDGLQCKYSSTSSTSLNNVHTIKNNNNTVITDATNTSLCIMTDHIHASPSSYSLRKRSISYTSPNINNIKLNTKLISNSKTDSSNSNKLTKRKLGKVKNKRCMIVGRKYVMRKESSSFPRPHRQARRKFAVLKF